MKSCLLFLLVNILFISPIDSQSWKTYPYHQSGSLIYFPQDEGKHPEEPTEWWYLTGQVIGETSGTRYSFMLSYFHYEYAGFDGFRILNLSNEDEQIFYPDVLPVFYSLLASDSLHIQTTPPGGEPEIWVNKTNADGTMIPFEYHVEAAQEFGSVNLNIDTFKRPLMIADSGFINQGLNNYTYYYTLTGLNISGQIDFNGIVENISGTGWMDHQYGDFNPYTGENYEWFSVQLSNGMDMNFWNIFTDDNMIPDTSTYRECSIYINETQDTAISDFQLERLEFEYMPDSGACYSKKWRFFWNDIDLTISVNSTENELEIPFRFYEGTTLIEGTVGNEQVTGIGFAELLHSYESPEIEFVKPHQEETWTESPVTIAWLPLNPDEGNPLYYNLLYSTDGGENMTEIISNYIGLNFVWDFSLQPDNLYYQFILNAHSIDSTLVKQIISDSVYVDLFYTTIEDGLDELITIYPNPSENKIYFTTSKLDDLKIIDLNGNILRSDVFTLKQEDEIVTEVDVSNLESGIYLLRFTCQGKVINRKLIIN